MLNEVASIVECYDTLEMTPEQIAEDRGLDIVMVKAALMQNSRKYNKDLKGEDAKDPRLNFTDDDLANAHDVIRKLSKHAEDEHLKFKAAVLILDEKKGRREVAKLLNGNGQINIFQINQQLAAARAGANKLKEMVMNPQKAIEV